MNVLDLFSGIGGLSFGLERAGMRTVAFCESDPFCRAVLAKHWPDVPCHHDIRTLNGHSIEADVVCGGFPCQDLSNAGDGEGLTGTRSGLWFEFHRIIDQVRPRYVIVENVTALRGRGLDQVLGSLAQIRYDAEWHCIPAAAFGADHIRDRLWVCAYPQEIGRSRRWGSKSRPPLLEACGLVPQRDRAWPNAADSFGAVYGLPGRLDRIGACGNSVYPEIPEMIGRAIMKTTALQRGG